MSTTIVSTQLGPVRGERRADGTLRFLGIPYAQPPVGPLRFASPVPARAWTVPLDATSYGPTAQRRPYAPVTTIPEPSIPGDDVLNLNVFTPSVGEGVALPVLVWIHGGGFIAGSTASPWYDGASFNRDGVVLVSIGYRLGVEGFLHVDDAPDNRAVRDWIAALEWVHDNIAAFGGDPARVTIAGQSAGANAVQALLATPAAQGLFRAAISASASIACHLTAPTPDRFGPFPDGELISEPVHDALVAASAGAEIPLMIGFTADEDATRFRAPALAIAEGRARAGCPTWLYRFEWDVAAYHCVDIPFAFDLLSAQGTQRVLGDSPPQSLADEIHGAWVRFVTDLDPGPSWPPYVLLDRATRRWVAVSGLVHSTDHA